MKLITFNRKGRKLGSKNKKYKTYTLDSLGLKRNSDLKTSKDPKIAALQFRKREIKAGRMKKGLFEK
jgi:hypothetical protein